MLRLTPEEVQYFQEKAAQDASVHSRSGAVNLSGYIRKCALRESGYRNLERMEKERKDLTYQVRKIGVNINQAVKKINSGAGGMAAQDLQVSLEELNRKFDTLLRRMEGKEAGDGSHEIVKY